MQKTKQLLILLLPFIGVAFIAFKPDFGGRDEHKIGKYYISVPNNMPDYNGLYWAQKQGDTLTIQPYNSREYQIQIDMDSLEIWDGDKLTGKVLLTGTALDSLITKDNE